MKKIIVVGLTAGLLVGCSPEESKNEAKDKSAHQEVSKKESKQSFPDEATAADKAKITVSTASAVKEALGGYPLTSAYAELKFTVPDGKGDVELHFQNQGHTETSVLVKHESSGHLYIEGEWLDPGEKITFSSNSKYPQGMRAGKYIVTASTSTGQEPNVMFYGSATTTSI